MREKKRSPILLSCYKGFNMSKGDFLRESWVYQEIGQKFFEEGFEEGFRRELEESQRVLWRRQTIMSFLQAKFPEIVALANQQTGCINDPEVLQSVILKLFAAKTA